MESRNRFCSCSSSTTTATRELAGVRKAAEMVFLALGSSLGGSIILLESATKGGDRARLVDILMM